MKGEYIKELLKKNGYTLNNIAEIMGETPQNLQSMLRASDIKTGVLERIASAINKNLYFFFDENEEYVKSVNSLNSENNITIPASVWEVIQKQADSLSSRDKQIDELINLMKEQNNEIKKIAARVGDNVRCADVG